MNAYRLLCTMNALFDRLQQEYTSPHHDDESLISHLANTDAENLSNHWLVSYNKYGRQTETKSSDGRCKVCKCKQFLVFQNLQAAC